MFSYPAQCVLLQQTGHHVHNMKADLHDAKGEIKAMRQELDQMHGLLKELVGRLPKT